MIVTFDDYQVRAVETRFSLERFQELHPDTPEDVLQLLAVAYDGLGLGEAGEVQGKIKKIIRDDAGQITDEHRKEIGKELGDILFYVASMCDNLNLSMREVAEGNIMKIYSRRDRGTLRGSGDNR